MSVDLLLKNGLVIVGAQEVIRSIGIRAGKIDGVYEKGTEPQSADSIDCDDHYILPGMIDMHVHLRDLKQSQKEDYVSGTMAAAAGGVTTVVDMPNSDPPVLDTTVLADKIQSARERRYVNVGFYVSVPKNVRDFDPALLTDALGIKVYPHAPLVKGVKFTEKYVLECMELAVRGNRPLLFHPDSSEPSERPASLDDYFRLHSCESELASVRRFANARSKAGGHLHVCHVSCAATAKHIMENREEDSLTAEVTPHHLLLHSDEFPQTTGFAKMLPPLRSPYDGSVLREMLCGKCAIDCIVSDHAPHTDAEKNHEFLEAASGIPGLETTMPLMLTEVLEGRMSWVDYLRACCSGPAKILGIQGKGIIAPGYDADIVVVKREEYTIRGSKFLSKAKMTPFEGRRVLAKPFHTIVEGRVVFSDGKIVVGRGTVGRVPMRKY